VVPPRVQSETYKDGSEVKNNLKRSRPPQAEPSSSDRSVKPVPSPNKRRRSPGEMVDVGKLIETLRVREGLTLAALAKAAGLKHATLSAIAYGRRSMTEHVLEKLSSAKGENDEPLFSRGDIDLLRRIGEETHAYLMTSGLGVPIKRLVRREEADDVAEVWIVDGMPPEQTDGKWVDVVVKNLLRHRRYVYFTTNRSHAETIEFKLIDHLRKEAGRSTRIALEFVIVPSVLETYVFHPGRILYRLNDGRVEGVWVLSSADTVPADSAAPMNVELAKRLYDEYQRLVGRLRRSRTKLTDDPLTFQLITAESIASKRR